MGVNYPTRDQVYAWLQAYDGQRRPTKRLRDYLIAKMGEVELHNDPVRGGKTVVDMILDDLDSYA